MKEKNGGSPLNREAQDTFLRCSLISAFYFFFLNIWRAARIRFNPCTTSRACANGTIPFKSAISFSSHRDPCTSISSHASSRRRTRDCQDSRTESFRPHSPDYCLLFFCSKSLTFKAILLSFLGPDLLLRLRHTSLLSP
jgi:hypothetical protein